MVVPLLWCPAIPRGQGLETQHSWQPFMPICCELRREDKNSKNGIERERKHAR